MYFIHGWSTALFVFRSHTLSCYQLPRLHEYQKWAYEVKGKKATTTAIWLGKSKPPVLTDSIIIKMSCYRRGAGGVGREPWKMAWSVTALVGPGASLLQLPLVQGLPFQTKGWWQHLEFLDISFQIILVHKTLLKICRWPINSRYSILFWNQAGFGSVAVGFNSK